jgi:hypothetical protein
LRKILTETAIHSTLRSQPKALARIVRRLPPQGAAPLCGFLASAVRRAWLSCEMTAKFKETRVGRNRPTLENVYTKYLTLPPAQRVPATDEWMPLPASEALNSQRPRAMALLRSA